MGEVTRKESWHIKILLRVLKIDTLGIIMTVMLVNAIWELYWPSLFKSATQEELDSGSEDLGFWPSYFKLYGLGQVLLSVNGKSNTYFSGIIKRNKWDIPRKRRCQFVFSTVACSYLWLAEETFFYFYKESEVSSTWVKWSLNWLCFIAWQNV